MEELDPFDLGPPMTEERWEIQGRLSPSEKGELCCQLTEIARTTLEALIRYRHPEYTEEQVALARNRRLWRDDQLFRQVYPNAPLLPV
ncbi:MAG TPA: hypothetical protein VNE39_06385 [Planctomycetota bacterium]|nr:hypothetical protein [Planctomycetota bacterium]